MPDPLRTTPPQPEPTAAPPVDFRAVVGTPRYVCPVRANGEPPARRIDLFRLGCRPGRLPTGTSPPAAPPQAMTRPAVVKALPKRGVFAGLAGTVAPRPAARPRLTGASQGDSTVTTAGAGQ